MVGSAATSSGVWEVEEEETLSAFSADDEIQGTQFVESEISRVGISVTKRDSIELADLEAAKRADIITLDLRFENVTYRSIQAASRLRSMNPYRAIFFFTRVPEEITVWPVNFAVKKDTDAAQHIARISLMILVHDVSLAILKDIDKLPYRLDWAREKEKLSKLFESLKRFYRLLFPTMRSAQFVDEHLAYRSRDLRMKLAPFIENTAYYMSAGRLDWLPPIHRILFGVMSAELSELSAISGVQVRGDLGAEVESLEEPVVAVPVLPEESKGEPRGVVEDAAREAAEGGEDDAETFYLNVWFPERSAEEPWLVVGRDERLLVNLGEQREGDALGTSDAVSEEADALLDTVDEVDVLILCSDADVVPLRNRIKVPPRKDTTAEFSVKPLRAGEISLTVVLLIKNDPIHRTSFFFEAREAEPVRGENTERIDTEEP